MSANTEALKAFAISLLRTLIRDSGGRGNFKGMFTLTVDDRPMPVLMIGTADGAVEDGDVIAILNPDPDLQNELTAGTSYLGGLLKEKLHGKCDAMVHVRVETYIKPAAGEVVLDAYNPRSVHGTAKFTVR